MTGRVSGWTESCALIGYPNGEDRAILPARDNPLCPARNKVFVFYILNPLMTKHFRSRWLNKLASFFCQFMDLDSFSVQKHWKNEFSPYPAIVTKQAWSIYPYVLLFKTQHDDPRPRTGVHWARYPFIFLFTQSQILSGKLQAGPTGTELGFHFPYLSKGLLKGYIWSKEFSLTSDVF